MLWLTVFLQRFESHIRVGGAKGIAYESPPPAQVVLPVVQTPEIMQLTEVVKRRRGDEYPENKRKKQKSSSKG